MLVLLWGCSSTQIQIVPERPTTEDTVFIRVLNGNDVEPVLSISWYKDHQRMVDSFELGPAWTLRDDIWFAEVTLENGSIAQSDDILISNALPTVEVEVTPSIPTAGYPVYCNVKTYDADGDSISSTIQWESEGGEIIEDNTISAAQSQVGTWECIVEVDDTFDVVKAQISTEIQDLPELPETDVALFNGSFEEESTNQDWNYQGCLRVDTAQGKIPFHGNWMLFGNREDCTAFQTIDVLANGFSEQHVDAQRLRIHIEGYLANNGTSDDYDDQIRLRVIFLDETQSELSTLDSLFGGEMDWVYRDAQRMIPVGTRYLQIQLVADWRVDQWNNSFADAIEYRIESADPTDPLLMKEPMLQDYRQDAMKIIWETDGVDHDPEILWGLDLENRVTNIRSTWIDEDHIVHVGVIEGLEAGQIVRYQVPVQNFEDFTFQTGPSEGSEFSMVWMGDNQEGYARFTQHINNFAPKDPDMLFVVGDLLEQGSNFWEWDSFWWEPLQAQNFAQKVPILAARGNHDMDHAYSYAYVDLPGNGSSYSFMYGDVWILVLNTHADLFPSNDSNFSGQYAFIEDELQSEPAQNAAFRLVTFHQGPYSNVSTSSNIDQLTGNMATREYWVPLFERYDVDSVISGHYHSYQRGELNGIQYLVTGGGGSTLLMDDINVWDWLSLHLTYQYTLMIREGNQLRWETYDLDENLIDTWTITQ